MSTLSELIKELNTLPKGNVYIKNINGKNYHYYQYFENGKRYTSILNNADVETLLSKITRRKEIEEIIKEYRSKDRNIVLSKNASELTGYVMSGNIMVAEFDHGKCIYVDEDLAPLIIKRTHSMERFLSLRMIDMSRTNARLLKRTLNINIDEDYKIALYAYALSINDNYWFKPKHSKLSFHNIEPNNDIYSDVALKGDTTVFPYKAKLTPEVTTTGSFEKGWKLIDGNWYLYKSGNDKQIFSELFSYKFAELIGINTVKYEYDGKYIRSKNFADKYNFEPIASLADENDNYDYIFDILIKIDELVAKDYLKIIFFDSVINNIDRHNENLGLMRDRRNGKIVSLAPNFDNNLALISSVDTLKEAHKDKFIEFFVKFIKSNEKAKSLFIKIRFPEITKEDLSNIVESISIKIDNQSDLIEKVYQRYNYLKNLF